MSSSPPKIVMLSSQRSHNLGDEAMCTSALRILRAEVGPAVSIVVRGPELLIQIDQENFQAKPLAAALCSGIVSWKKWWVVRSQRRKPHQVSSEPWLERYVLWIGFQFWLFAAWLRVRFGIPLPAAAAELIDELSSADLVMTVGGGWVNSSFQLTLQESLFALRVSQLRRPTPLLLLGDQFGPLTSHWDRTMVRRAFKPALVIAPRDHDSCQLARELGLPPERLKLFGDWAYAPEMKVAASPQAGQPLRIAINLRKAHYSPLAQEGLSTLARSLCTAARTQRLVLVPVPMCLSEHENDVAALRDFSEILRQCDSTNITILSVPTEGDAEGMRRRISECDAAIGVSYHFCLFSMMSGLSCLGLSTSEYFSAKLGGLFRLFQASEFVLSMTAGDQLQSQITHWLNQRTCCQTRLNQQNHQLAAEFAVTRTQIFDDVRYQLHSSGNPVLSPIAKGT